MNANRLSSGNSINIAGGDVTTIQGLASPLQLAMSTEPGKAIRHTISTIVDGIPALLKVLDDVAQIHPFIGSQSLCDMFRETFSGRADP